ncbi:hypothetical protein TUBRATIS_24910 [Tubulinosema ratisbonensis]|uniref:Glycoside hydrolase family 19 catalytic domain-containing protein n=1 Tax=Tubulinosema ratisbonensis TaxID=291195 RepID=A0A437AIT0_9MICR|nr:hypothetical protein TUBRATIS_24910 [Tubulinosema ratisbonensis]
MKVLQEILIFVFVCIIQGSEEERNLRDIPMKFIGDVLMKQARGESSEPIKFEITLRLQSENPRDIPFQPFWPYKRVSDKRFKKAIIRFLEETYWRPPFSFPNIPEVRKMLSLIYDWIDSFKELCIFTSLSMFGTGGYINMSQKYPPPRPGEKWYSRGLLQISGEENYKVLAKLTCDKEFLTNPDILATYDSEATEASVFFWNYLIKKRKKVDPDFEMNFDNGLKLLFPKFFEPGHEEEFKKFKKSRHELYEKIRELFEKGKGSGDHSSKHHRETVKNSSSSSDDTCQLGF